MQPPVYRLSAVLLFPGLQHFVVSAFGLNNLTGIWVLIDLDLSLTALATHSRSRDRSLICLRIQKSNDATQVYTVIFHQSAEFFLEFDFALQFAIVLQSIELLELSGELGFKGFEFCELGH